MRLRALRANNAGSLGRCRAEGFTLAEVLAALLFMAIVIPIAIEGLRVASQAGDIAIRKSQAVRVADRVLNETIAMTNWSMANQSGTITEGNLDFRWTLDSQPWSQNMTNQIPLEQNSGSNPLMTGQPTVSADALSQTTMNLLTATVTYMVQNKERTVSLSTLVGSQ